MSENNQNPHPVSKDEKKEPHRAQNGQGHRNHRRSGRGHRPYPNEKSASASQQATPEQQAQAVQKEEGGAQKPRTNGAHQESHKPQHNHGHNKGGERRQSHDGNQRKNSRGMKGFRQPPERRPYDPYEKPSKEEIELSELRAQIVLKSADGTVPTVYGTPPAPQEPIRQEEQSVKAEEKRISEDIPMSPAPESPTPEAAGTQRVEVIGVRFRSAGKMYYFDPHGIKAHKGDFAIVETTRGPEFGDICMENRMVNISDTVSPLRPLIRIATSEDIAHNAENREKEKAALQICQEKIRAHGLEMKLIDVQYAFDNSKLLFYFAAEGRVDFRELVKDLASVFRTRIELRQIGIRDEAKMLGGIGACGRALCCSTFLPDFAQVSIKMAKEQNLSLNSTKISGVCGRLMCCLRYEAETYSEEIRKTPANDSLVRTEDGIGTVISSNPLAGTIRVVLKDSPDAPPKQYHRDEVTVLPKERRGNGEHREGEKNDEKDTD